MMPTSTFSRAILLFLGGAFMSFTLLAFQFEDKLQKTDVRFLISAIVVSVLFFGSFSVGVGIMYPYVVRKFLGSYNFGCRHATEVCKSIVIYLGLNHLSAAISFKSDAQFGVAIILSTVIFWMWNDKTLSGLLFGLFMSLFSFIFVELLSYTGMLRSSVSSLYLKTCVPCLWFAGSLTIANIGRLLIPREQTEEKPKSD